MDTAESPTSLDFIRSIVADDLRDGRHEQVVTRFPPEPNGHLHIGHAKSICLNFGVASEYGGVCHLRFDDTNPIKEEQEYIDAIKQDVRWLGFDWGEHEYYASDYFDQLYEWACQLVRDGHAYVDDQDAEAIRRTRGTLTRPGTPSPWRDRDPKQSLELLEQMKDGAFPDGSKVLRARIDMAAPNMNLRDPVMYRILKATHPRTQDRWCIYPMYDFAHGQSDSIERVTHSLCTLEFEAHRPLYDWFCQTLEIYPPRQIEFARLKVTHTVLSKRKLLQLVQDGLVHGWDDPRMPTLSGMRRRGYPPRAIREFCQGVGVTKRDQVIDLQRLEHHVRGVLNVEAQRRMAVLDPLRVVIENYPEGQVEQMPAINNPEDPEAGTRAVPFSRELYIERDDFMEDPPKKFFRLAPGREVRLRYAYWVTCTQAIKDDQGNVVELRCTYDPDTRGGDAPPPDAEGKVRKVKGTLHWVSAAHGAEAEVRLYEPLFRDENPEAKAAAAAEAGERSADESWREKLHPNSMRTTTARVEPALVEAEAGQTFQFERLGYFCADPETRSDRAIFNRAVTLRDSWAKQKAKGSS